MVGENFFSNFLVGYFIWTPHRAIEPISEYLAGVGVVLPSTAIRFSVDSTDVVALEICDGRGRRVRSAP